MPSLYLLFKFLHIVAVSVWIGGGVAVTVINLQLLRGSPAGGAALLAELNARLRKMLIPPAAGTTLVAGGVAMFVSGIGFPFWIAWGLLAMAVGMGVGGTVVRRRAMELAAHARSAGPGDPQVGALARGIARLDAALFLLLLSTVWVMVAKPVL